MNQIAEAVEHAGFDRVAVSGGYDMPHTDDIVIWVAFFSRCQRYRRRQVETLAYGYSLQAPKKTKARHNVRVQWRNTDNQAVPITHPGNAEWRRTFEGWANITTQMTIMQMTANGGSFVMPTPNWLSLPEDIAWFSRHNVRGFFAWAPAYFPTLAMSELRAYVMASMLWDATRNATQEVDEFIRLFYGEAAAPHVWAHFGAWSTALSELNMTRGVADCPGAAEAAGQCTMNDLFRYGGFMDCGAACNNGKLHCTDSPSCFCVYPGSCYLQPWVTPSAVVPSAIALRRGLDALPAGSPEQRRLEKVFLGVSYLLLTRWAEMCAHAQQTQQPWPLPARMSAAVAAWQRSVQAQGIVTLFPGPSYNATSIDEFLARQLNSTCEASGVRLRT